MPPPPRTRARRPPLGAEVRPLLRPDLPGALCMQGSYGSRTVAPHRTTSSSTTAYARLVIIVPGLHMAERTAGGPCYLGEHPLRCVLIHTGVPDAPGAGHAASVDRRGAMAPPPARHCLDADAARATAAALAAVGARVLAPGHGFSSIGGRLPVRGRR